MRLSPHAAQASPTPARGRGRETVTIGLRSDLTSLKRRHWPLVAQGYPLYTCPVLRFAKASRPVTPAGSLHPFGAGPRLRPYPPHYRTAFACSRICYLHHLPLSLPSGYSLDVRVAQPREWYRLTTFREFHRSASDASVYTGWVFGCVGLPLKLTDRPTMPFWRWSRRAALAPRVSRCVTPRLWLPSPYRSFPEVRPVCHSPFVLLLSA
jgi:hypothetical protein